MTIAFKDTVDHDAEHKEHIDAIGQVIAMPGFDYIMDMCKSQRDKALSRCVNGRTVVIREKARETVRVVDEFIKSLEEIVDELKEGKNA